MEGSRPNEIADSLLLVEIDEEAQRHELLTQIAIVLHNLYKINVELEYQAKRDWRRLALQLLPDKDIENTTKSKYLN